MNYSLEFEKSKDDDDDELSEKTEAVRVEPFVWIPERQNVQRRKVLFEGFQEIESWKEMM